MRLIPVLCGFAALAFAHGASAAPVTLAPVSFSPEFETDLQEEYGQREGEYLRNTVVRAVSAALERRGASVGAGAPVTIEIVILEADPNRPTFQQLADEPGLDMIRSYSIGGAELVAVLRGADGHVLAEVNHRRYNATLDEFFGVPPATWSEARRAIHQFANKVADAYVTHASAG